MGWWLVGPEEVGRPGTPVQAAHKLPAFTCFRTRAVWRVPEDAHALCHLCSMIGGQEQGNASFS